MDGHLFNNIHLGGRGGNNPGQLKVHARGLLWKKQGGGKAVEVDKSEITGLTWMKVPRSNQLGVRIKDGLHYKFTGFRDQDVSSLTTFFQTNCGLTTEEKQLSLSGKNWGEVDLNGNMLQFLVGSKQAFEISLADVSQTQLQGKTDVMLEFHVDDTTGASEKDSLMEISFHVPNSNTQFVGDENCPPAQVFRDKIVAMADVSDGEEAVVTFDGIAILTPRGRYNVELHLSFLRLQGQANDFKIQYSSVQRIFLLPKVSQPHTFVVVTLDPPIRKGQTMYPNIVLQFESEYVVDTALTMSEDVLNTKYKDRLELTYKGLIHDVFTKIMRGLSGAKITGPGKFRSHTQGLAVKSSLKAEDGLLYPLDKGFFFLPKPPTLMLYDEIDYVEFERHAAGTANMHYFDLLVRLKTEQEHIFRNIQRSEYSCLYSFISAKGLKIMNLRDSRPADGVTAVLRGPDDDDAVDPHLMRIRNQASEVESDEEDEDFVAEKDDEGSPTDDSGEEGSDGSLSGGEEKPVKKPKKEASAPKPTPSRRKIDDEGSSKKKRPKKKKDPSAPKRAMTAFMFFSQSERENVKKSNPGIPFTEMGRVLGDKWNKLSAEEKEPYEAMSKADKLRYSEQMSGYNNNQQSTNMDTGGNDDSDSA
ncbi:unnamed protein product [Cuscuta epithymum]|uniref:FACT complex subunit SSRP1 n=1 Tax=Cuscuta epithymum TaxID=186058 RepID=A0AAV0E742_9ASTE|nr:unnamed protein product [Cuscuta epithymum]